MEITHHGQRAVVAGASSRIGWPTAERFANGEAIATEPRGHSPSAVYVHVEVTLGDDGEAVVDTAACTVARRDALVNVVSGVRGAR